MIMAKIILCFLVLGLAIIYAQPDAATAKDVEVSKTATDLERMAEIRRLGNEKQALLKRVIAELKKNKSND